jgi:hypothetical protein
LVKWITCAVSDRDAFDRGQRQWAGLRSAPGFLGQGGGWDRETAHVFGFWADRSRYDGFMAASHDALAAAQAGTYREIQVRLFERRSDIGVPFLPDFTDAVLIRLAYCQIHPGRTGHFTTAEAEIWNPGMARTPGMVRGDFAEGPTGFLVLSLWRSAADHENYRRERFPQLRAQAEAGADLSGITGHLVDVEPAWWVRPA